MNKWRVRIHLTGLDKKYRHHQCIKDEQSEDIWKQLVYLKGQLIYFLFVTPSFEILLFWIGGYCLNITLCILFIFSDRKFHFRENYSETNKWPRRRHWKPFTSLFILKEKTWKEVGRRTKYFQPSFVENCKLKKKKKKKRAHFASFPMQLSRHSYRRCQNEYLAGRWFAE